MLQIRRYESADAEAVSVLIGTTMRVSNSVDYPIERLELLINYFSPSKVEALSHERVCLVAELDGKIVGTAALDRDELVTFFVHPDQQGNGIGSALMQDLEMTAHQQGCHEVKVDASINGVGFYERHGFRQTGSIIEGSAGKQIQLCKSYTEV